MKSHSEASAPNATSAAMIRPARRPGASSARMKSQTQPTKSAVLHASPNSNLRLKPIFLHSAVERAAAETQFGSRQRDVEVMHPQCPLDHLPLELVEIQALSDDGDNWRLSAVR